MVKDRPSYSYCFIVLAAEGRHTGPAQISWKITAACFADLEQVHSGNSNVFLLAENIVSLNIKNERKKRTSGLEKMFCLSYFSFLDGYHV